MRYRILILGGYGNFGRQICRRLAETTDAILIVAGRRHQHASTMAASLSNADRQHEALSIDLDSPRFMTALQRVRPNLVIHTSGPFQGQDHRVAEACLQIGSDYIDLADGRAFVEGFSQLDARARQAQRLLISGASTLPGLSSAVVNEYVGEFQWLESIRVGITPGQCTPRGLATMAAVLGYCGQSFDRREDGRWKTVRGWQDLRRFPHPVLGRRLWGACDVPDLGLFPQRWSELREVTFHAGLELVSAQLGLWLAAWAVRLRLVRNMSQHARVVHRAAAMLDRFGSGNGGMFVSLHGTDPHGRRKTLDWWLTAWAGYGPFIPCVPAIVIARRLAAGDRAATGAMPCIALMRLDEFSEAVRHLPIEYTVTRRVQ